MTSAESAALDDAALDDAALDDVALDYEALYARYLASLIDDLRGFRAAAPGLELWVPDENPLASLRNLFDAARLSGRHRVVVRLSAKTLTALGSDSQRLLSMAQTFGDARLSLDAGGAVLDVSALDVEAPGRVARRSEATASEADDPSAAQPRPARTLQPRDGDADDTPVCLARASAAREAAAFSIYRPALERAAAEATHRGRSLDHRPGLVIARARADGAELNLAVDAGSHRVVAASFEAQDASEIGLLQGLCDVIGGLPLLEAAEHGTIRLEKVQRGAAQPPVPGIVLPESQHPLFRWARALLGQALSDYRRQTGFEGVHSRHDDRPGEAWQRADDAERRAWLARALAAALAARGLEPNLASVEGVRHDVRVELSLELPAAVDAAALVMELERALKSEVDPRLEVYVTERRDENAKRRLAVLAGAA